MMMNQLPNLLTILRMALVLPILVALFMGFYQLAFYLVLFAGITDGIDGYLARRYQCSSRFGSIADPLADKILIVATVIALAMLHQLPWWLVWIVFARDLIIVAGGLAYHYLIGPYKLAPVLMSKINTFFEIVLVVMVLCQLAYGIVDEQWIKYTIYCVLFTNIASLLRYVYIWGSRAYWHKKSLQTKEQLNELD